MIYLYLAIILVLSYLIGNINFARIFSWAFAKKDITTVGSHNPGTMNMLRTRGFGEAILTLFMEAIKSGLPALISYFVIEHFFAGFGNIAFFVAGLGAILGHCFPVFYKFKGGKGVACTFGMFTFHPDLWWISLIVFVVCFLLMLFVIKYGSVISFIYILTMSVTSTCIFVLQEYVNFIPFVVIIWLNALIVIALHHGNIKRLFTGKESKIDLMSKLKKKKTVVSVEEGSDKSDEEIIVENDVDKTESMDNKDNEKKND